MEDLLIRECLKNQLRHEYRVPSENTGAAKEYRVKTQLNERVPSQNTEAVKRVLSQNTRALMTSIINQQ